MECDRALQLRDVVDHRTRLDDRKTQGRAVLFGDMNALSCDSRIVIALDGVPAVGMNLVGRKAAARNAHPETVSPVDVQRRRQEGDARVEENKTGQTLK